MTALTPSNAQKQAVWSAYRAGRPTRVPMTLVSNPRVFLLDPQWNTAGYTFEQAARDPEIHVKVALHFQLYVCTELAQFCDLPAGPPEQWEITQSLYNVYEAAALGAEIHFAPGQVPDTRPMLDADNRESIFDVDIERPLELPTSRTGWRSGTRWIASAAT